MRMNYYESFLKLHEGPAPLLLGNFWDVNSARIFERNGFKAIATSSEAVANSFGYADGENLPFDLLVQLTRKVVEEAGVPCSADMEKGYSRSVQGIIENIRKLHDVGVVGINLEDSLAGKRELMAADTFQKNLAAIREHLDRHNMKVFLNIRTDAFLLRVEDPLTETLDRIRRYESVGANGIFVPFISGKSDIVAVTGSTRLPVNVLCIPELTSIPELQEMGVRRISLGSGMFRAMNNEMEKKLKAIHETQTFQGLF